MSDDDLTTRLVAAFEKAAKGMRDGIIAASDNLAYVLNSWSGQGCGNDVGEGAEQSSGAGPRPSLPRDQTPSPAAGSPQNAAVVAPSPKQGSDSGPADSDILTSPAGPHPNPYQEKDDSFLLNAAADIVEAWAPLVVSGSPGTVWVDQFLHALRDRAAQFAGLEDTYQPEK